MRKALLPPRITRRSALKMAGAGALPALIKPARAADERVLRAAFAIQPATLDPQKMRVGGVDYNYVYNCFSRVTAQDPNLRVQPDLATSWDATEDLKTWTFHLRPGVKFHNGKPFDASDVVFTFKRILDKEVGSVLRVNFSMVDSIETVDPLTARFNLSIPYADLPAAVAAYQAAIVSESALDTLTTHPIAPGPFKFVDYRPRAPWRGRSAAASRPEIAPDLAVSPVFPQGRPDRRRRHRRCEEIAGRSGDPQRLGARNVRAGQQSRA